MRNLKIFGRIVLAAVLFVLPVLISESLAQEVKRDVSGFNSISYVLPGKLTIIPGNKESLIIKGDQETTDKIITEVKDNELKIYTKWNTFRGQNFEIVVTVISLNELSVAGSGNVVIEGTLKSNKFELDLSGSGNVMCNRIEGSELEVNIAGSGDITMAGKVNKLEIDIAGSGDVNTGGLETQNAEVDIAGSGSATVWVNDKLETDIVGSGNVYYKGKPLVDAETAGSGRTRPAVN
jgi:hypothetical protein